MTDELLAAAALLLLGNLLLTLWLLLRIRNTPAPTISLEPILQNQRESHDRTDRVVRDEIARNRSETGEDARKTREELKTNFDGFALSLLNRIAEAGVQQRNELTGIQTALKSTADSGNANLAAIRDTLERKLGHIQSDATQIATANRTEMAQNFAAISNELRVQIQQMAAGQMQQLAKFETAISALTLSSEQKLETVRQTVEGRLTAMQTDNAAKLELMRATVDEKLHATLETRLGASFKLVSDRLELVHKGLGEMQSLANGVGDLKKVLTNIKTRGTWGEVALGNLLEQLFTPDQYAANVQVNPQTLDRVEYAIKLPGRDGTDRHVWLPIDAKFPDAEYQRLVDAAEAGNAETVAACAAALENQICGEAKKINEKYVTPPHTTDFAILFLPTEGLFAEVLRRPGLCARLQLNHRILLAGPTTLSAMLSSLQMGFRTLAIEKRSSEVWQVLGGVKTEFSRFGEVLDKVHKKLEEATNTIESARVRKRAVERQLKEVEEFPTDAMLDLASLEHAAKTGGIPVRKQIEELNT